MRARARENAYSQDPGVEGARRRGPQATTGYLDHPFSGVPFILRGFTDRGSGMVSTCYAARAGISHYMTMPEVTRRG